MDANNRRVLVALSGGVDSAVSVILLREQGYDVAGICMEFSPAHRSAVEGARATADFLGIPFFTLNLHDAFDRLVITPFCEEYRRGRTPNPCVVCNPLLKFKALRDEADRLGYGWIATGHYAGVVAQNGRFSPRMATCRGRDQSYMLYRLTQAQLSRLLFPLEGLEKSLVREKARAAGLHCAETPDSQEICFTPDGTYPALIEGRYGPSPEGAFIGPDGKEVGRHKGIIHYTVGQRKGLGVSLGRPVFVRSISPEDQHIHLVDAKDGMAAGVSLTDCVYPLFSVPPQELEVTVKIRSMAKPTPAIIRPLPGGEAEVRFVSPQRMPAPGQSAVCYLDDVVVGGGFIRGWL